MSESFSEKVKQRVEGRKLAGDLIAEFTEGESPEWVEGFMRELHRVSGEAVGNEHDDFRMTDKEAKAYESTKLTFGKHNGEEVGSVDIGYIVWVTEGSRKMLSYLRSDRGKRRIEEGR